MEEIKHILFVVNPISGDNNKADLIQMMESELKNRNIALTIFETTGEKDQEAIKDLTNEYTFNRVFIAGGDGTIKMTTEAILNMNLPIAIFPAGSANGFALNFDIPNTPKEQLEIALSDNLFTIDLIQINDEFSLHLADFGVNAELIKNYDASIFRGKIGYLMQTLPTLIKSDHPFHFEIEIDGEVLKRKGSVLSIANCQKYGTGACINPSGIMDDGIFEIILFKNLNLIEIVKTFTNQISLDAEFAEIFKATSALVTCIEPVPFQVDGEYVGELDKLKISILKKAVQLFVPDKFI